MELASNAFTHSTVADFYRVYLQHLLEGNRQACLGIVKELMARDIPLKRIYLELFERSMYQIGEMWETNRISVATEHIATAITENAMSLLYPLIFAAEHCGRKAIVSCVANEYHQIGGKMVADLFEFHGWDGYFLGANTPINDLMRLVVEKQPDLVCLSLTLYSNLPDLLRHIHTLLQNFPRQKILVGGQAFRHGGLDVLESVPQVQFIGSLDELEQIIRQFP